MKLLIKNQNGFTLIELLIALVIFAVGILGVGAMQLTSIKGNSKGRLISEASNLAADRIEMLLALNYNHPTLVDDDDGKDETDADSDTNSGDGTDQDANSDGTDDDGGNFGLDDLTNPDGADDSDGDGVNDVFWNVAVDYPGDGMKTIKVTVIPPGSGSNVTMEVVRAELYQD